MDQAKQKTLPLMIGAIGVVFGDIGTSPLYALKSCFAMGNILVNQENILGIISLFLWLLILVVNIKYIAIVMNCSQQGEGGVLVLSMLSAKTRKYKKFASVLGIIAMALFVGDSIITPAISVLSAAEGIKLIVDISENTIIVMTLVILAVLFIFQNKGSGEIGRYFGYIMLLWFFSIAYVGLLSIIKSPKILIALNPYYAVSFLFSNKASWLVLSGAILVITGVEALYADMGHFTKEAINKSWIFYVFPALALNYLGQGGLLLDNYQAISNPFYLLVPSKLIYPFIILSIVATIIASQAVISGMFSLIWQAIMLNYLPRMRVVHTSSLHRGQIYIPSINYILCVLTMSAVVIFASSDKLAAAYGFAVAGVMLISTILAAFIVVYQWKWSLFKVMLIFLPLFSFDIIVLVMNFSKIISGAWYTVMIAIVSIYLLYIWQKGLQALKSYKFYKPGLKSYLYKHLIKYPARIPGCAIFMSRAFSRVSHALELHIKHNKFLHEKIIFLVMMTQDDANVLEDKIVVEEIMPKIFNIKLKFGFNEKPNFTEINSWLVDKKILEEKEDISIFFSRAIPVASDNSTLNGMAEAIYIFMAKNALSAYEFFSIDSDQAIELGIRYKI
jgi:KUP system potassium uptake protein